MACISFILAIIIICMLVFYGGEIRLQGIFLEYGRRFLHDWIAVYAYIPLFILFMAGLLALTMFQHLAYSSRGVANSDLWNFANPGVLGVLNILEFIWAFQFLRDACTSSNIQSTSAWPAVLPTGTGTPTTQNAQPPWPDSSLVTGAAWWLVPS